MSPIHQAPTALSYWLVGVDVGGTTVSTVLLDEDLQSHGELTVATDLTSPDATMLGIVAAIEQTLALDDSPRKLAAIGLGIPGQQDQAQGIVRIAVNLHWYDYPLVARLVEHFGAPCVIENDVRVATLGVYRFDNPAGEQDLAYISIGTGLATGVILEGKLLRGRHGLAGEFGHIIVDPNGPLCNCGAHGCLETLVSATAVVRRAREALAQGADGALATLDPLNARGVYDAAAAGDIAAQQIVDDVGTELARSLRSVVLAYDVDNIVLGGGVTRAGDRYLQPIIAEWLRQQETSALARAVLRPEILRIADPTRNLGAWGAAALAAELLGE
ncbi:ROK family protein [Caldilinea sp.]|uniref:ROK family protein n=1 Tax=Caldilinea sp. TaxID=2293560 RepID=UPI002BFA5332|nr:ROK family protein [Caldilinea sp.]HRA68158.1 ROK family protein [Caldilinea sp.]